MYVLTKRLRVNCYITLYCVITRTTADLLGFSRQGSVYNTSRTEVFVEIINL